MVGQDASAVQDRRKKPAIFDKQRTTELCDITLEHYTKGIILFAFSLQYHFQTSTGRMQISLQSALAELWIWQRYLELIYLYWSSNNKSQSGALHV